MSVPWSAGPPPLGTESGLRRVAYACCGGRVLGIGRRGSGSALPRTCAFETRAVGDAPRAGLFQEAGPFAAAAGGSRDGSRGKAEAARVVRSDRISSKKGLNIPLPSRSTLLK